MECHLAIDGFMVLLIFNRGVLHKFISSSEHAQEEGVGSSANKPKIYYFKILEKKEGKKKSLMTLVMHVVNMHSARHLSNHNYNYNYNYQKHQALFDICIQSCF
jgi:hypothetical protein